MTTLYDVAAIGNAIVDVISPASDDFLSDRGLIKGTMRLIDDVEAQALYARMAAAVEASGGSACNSIAGLSSFGGRGAFIGKIGVDELGAVFTHDIEALGVRFGGVPLTDGVTGRCLINVTPDGERTMTTCLGAAALLEPSDVDSAIIEAAAVVYLEGYLFDPEPARRAFAKAAGLARASGRLIALTLSDAFVVERHRGALLGFIESEVDILFANEAEITALYQTKDFDEAVAAARGKAKISAITRGKQGSTIISGDETHHVNAVPIEKVVDTTGAGDQYAAGFLHGLARGLSLDHCGRLGSLAAAEVIAHYGPRPQVSLRDLATQAGL
jgi:sugar/nucleoside kinase (ribokinase family)